MFENGRWRQVLLILSSVVARFLTLFVDRSGPPRPSESGALQRSAYCRTPLVAFSEVEKILKIPLGTLENQASYCLLLSSLPRSTWPSSPCGRWSTHAAPRSRAWPPTPTARSPRFSRWVWAELGVNTLSQLASYLTRSARKQRFCMSITSLFLCPDSHRAVAIVGKCGWCFSGKESRCWL